MYRMGLTSQVGKQRMALHFAETSRSIAGVANGALSSFGSDSAVQQDPRNKPPKPHVFMTQFCVVLPWHQSAQLLPNHSSHVRVAPVMRSSNLGDLAAALQTIIARSCRVASQT